MKKSHIFYLVESQHFNNLSISNNQIQKLLYRQFGLIQWFLAKFQVSQSQIEQLKIFKVQMGQKTQRRMAYLIQRNRKDETLIQKVPSKGNLKKNFAQNQEAFPSVILIVQELNIQKYQVQVQRQREKQYKLYVNPRLEITQVKTDGCIKLSNEELSLKCKQNLVGNLKIEFKSRINNSKQSLGKQLNHRNHIEMRVIQTTKVNNVKSPLQMLCMIFNIDSTNPFPTPNILMKLHSVSSYLSLQQSRTIRNLRVSNKDMHQLRYEFVFRNFHNMVTKDQLLQLANKYAYQVYEMCKNPQKAYNKKEGNKEPRIYEGNSSYAPQHHFICSASNSFIPFLMSLSNIISLQQSQDYLRKYVKIIHPSYSSFLVKTTKGQSSIELSEEKLREIKKAINFILHKLILQYSKEITTIASELSFVFEIVQVLNQSLITKEFIDQLFALLTHYGGLYPEILLSADSWVKEIQDQSQRYSISLSKPLNQKKQQDSQFSLAKTISAGRMTRFKQKISPLLSQILSQLKKTIHDGLTFQDHFKITSNAFTIVAFDITHHTIRFFNYLTTPKMNIIDFLYLCQKFECIEIKNEWTPYKIVNDNQTFLVNLQGNIITSPIGVQYLDQFFDSPEVRKRYFDFLSSINQGNKFTKCIFNGKNSNDTVYQQRLKQFQLKRHKIISQIKNLIFSNIPKTKLIWRFIRFQSSSKQIIKSEQSDTFSLLKKVEIINHVYNLFKTIISHEKNLNRQVWLQSQCNLLDEVPLPRKNFIQDGQEKGMIEWEIERINHLKEIINKKRSIENHQSKDKSNLSKEYKTQLNLSSMIRVNVLNRAIPSYPLLDIISETQKFKILSNIQNNLNAVAHKIDEIQSSLPTNCPLLSSIRMIIHEGLKQILQKYIDKPKIIDEKQNAQQVAELISYVEKHLIAKIESLEQQNNETPLSLFAQIRKIETQTMTSIIDNYLNLLQQSLKFTQEQSGRSQLSWFQIQKQNHKLVESLFMMINNSLTIDAKRLMMKIFFKCGAKQIQTYDFFMTNFPLIEKRIDKSLLGKISGVISKEEFARNKINLIIDCRENSELYTQLYLRLLFEKFQKIQNSQKDWIDCKLMKMNVQDFFDCRKDHRLKDLFRLQNYFESLTCSGFQSIAVLELILRNNFQQNSKRKKQSFDQILSKLPSYKHLLSWTSSQVIDRLFDDFHWHLIEQQKVQQFYEIIYTEEYKKQLQFRSKISPNKIVDLKKAFENKSKREYKSLFSEERKKIYGNLIYEILEEWCEIVAGKKQQGQKLSQMQNEITLDQVIENKIQYNNAVLQTYSILQKKQVRDILKKYIQKFGIFFEQVISITIDSIPHSDNQWKGILLKKAICGFKLKKYIQNMIQSYQLNPNITFEDLNLLGRNNFHGIFNILLWNCSSQSIEVCNHLTKPKMPLWFAILSTCIIPFYMEEQFSHKKWQNPQQTHLRSFSHKFLQKKQVLKEYQSQKSTSLTPESNQSQFLKKDQINGSISGKSYETQSLIDQQFNKYLNPAILQSFPLQFLTNPYFGVIKKEKPKLITLSFQKADGGFQDRIRNTFLEGRQLNFNISNMLSLHVNKKDKNIRVLRKYIRKILRQTHFGYYFETIFNRNNNLYSFYKHADRTNFNFDVFDEARKKSFEVSSSEDRNIQIAKGKSSKGSDKIIKENQLKVKLSKIQVEAIDSQEEEQDLNQNIHKANYRFYQTYEQAEEEKKVEDSPSSATRLAISQQQHFPQCTSYKKNSNNLEKVENESKEEKNKKKHNTIKKTLFSCFLDCTCFGGPRKGKNSEEQKFKRKKDQSKSN